MYMYRERERERERARERKKGIKNMCPGPQLPDSQTPRHPNPLKLQSPHPTPFWSPWPPLALQIPQPSSPPAHKHKYRNQCKQQFIFLIRRALQ